MTDMTATRREFAIDLCDQHCREFRADPDLDSGERAWNALSMLSLMVFEVTEVDLRDTLTLAGLDLKRDEDWQEAQNYVGLFVRAGCIEVQELMIPTILDLGTSLATRYDINDELRATMDKIRTDGIFWREFLLPQHVE